MFWWKRRRHPRVQISRAVWGLCKAAHGFQRKPKTARTAPVTSHRFETRKKETVICGEQERDIKRKLTQIDSRVAIEYFYLPGAMACIFVSHVKLL